MPGLRASALAVIAALALGGCGTAPRQADGAAPAEPALDPIPPEKVGDALTALCDLVQSRINGTALAVEQALPGDALRRLTLRWRIRAFEVCQRARTRDNALAGLIEVWYWTMVTARRYTSGAGKDEFGAQQALVVGKLQELTDAAERMVRRAVPPDRFPALKSGVLAATSTGDAYLLGDASPTNPLASLLEASQLTRLLSLPLAPFDAFSGVKAGGDAAARMAVTADRAVALLADYPKLIDWHLQAALLEVQSQGAVRTMLAELQRSNASLEAAIALARGLPAQLRTEGLALLDQSRPAQADVRETLRAVSTAADALQRLSGGIERLLAELTPATGATPAAGPPARPFDIREYTASLEAAATTARDLRATLAETSALLAAPAVPARIAEARGTLAGLIADIALWSIAVLVAATACAVLILRARRRAGPAD